MRVAHTCRLPPSGALLSSIYLKCDSVVKCAHMQCRCSVLRQCTRSAHGAVKAWPMDVARRRLTRLLAARLPALGGFTVVPLVPGLPARPHCLVPLWARRRLQSGSFHGLRAHPDIRTRTGSCTSATAARIRSAHVDGTSAVRAGSAPSLVASDFHLPLLLLSRCVSPSPLPLFMCERTADKNHVR